MNARPWWPAPRTTPASCPPSSSTYIGLQPLTLLHHHQAIQWQVSCCVVATSSILLYVICVWHWSWVRYRHFYSSKGFDTVNSNNNIDGVMWKALMVTLHYSMQYHDRCLIVNILHKHRHNYYHCHVSQGSFARPVPLLRNNDYIRQVLPPLGRLI